MARLPFVPLTIEVTLVYDGYGNTNVQNKLYFTYGSAPTGPTMQTFVNEIATGWGANMAAVTHVDTSLLAVLGNDIATATGVQGLSTGAAIPGTVQTTPLSIGAAFVMSYEGALKYRGGHSRNYLPGMVGNDLGDGNTWTEAFQLSILNAWTAFLSYIVQHAPAAMGSIAHVIAHRYGASATAPVLASGPSTLKSVPLTNPFTEPILAVKTNPQVGSQRRRNQQVS